MIGMMMSIIFISCSSNVSQKQEVVPVRVSYVNYRNIANNIHLSGNIEGSKTSKIGFMVNGRINRIYYKEGEKISKGALVAELDPVNYEIAKEVADASLAQVEDEYHRISKMYEQGSVSEADYMKIKNALAQAQATHRLHTQNLKETKIYAPTQGVLLKKLFEEGEIVGSGIPIFVISDILQSNANAFVPEEELQEIHIGQKANIQVNAVNNKFQGTIIEIGSLADGMARSFPIKIKFQNSNLQVRPGMIASIDIPTGKKKQTLCVPLESVLHNTENESYVFIVDTTVQKVFTRNIVLGRLIDKEIEVLHGLSVNELIVTAGQQKLYNASSVSYK